MNDIGEFTLMVALATALYGTVAYVMAARGNRIDLYLSADKVPIITWVCVMISSIALWKAFFTNDFSLQYVYAYSNIELDYFYKFSSFWGGQGVASVLDSYFNKLHDRCSHSKSLKEFDSCALCDGGYSCNYMLFPFSSKFFHQSI